MKNKCVVGSILLAAVCAVWQQTNRGAALADVNPPANLPASPPANQPDPPPPDPARAPSPQTVRRIFDVRDLIKSLKNYPLAGGPMTLTQLNDLPANSNQQHPQQNGPLPQAPLDSFQREANEVTARADALQRLITQSIDKSSWQTNGGPTGTITWFDGQFLIMQTPENQKAVEKLLDELRVTRGRVVRLRADWLLLAPGQIEKLEKNPDDASAVPEISRDLLRGLPQETVHYSGSILCFSGQTVSITSGRAKSVVTGLTPIQGYEVANVVPTVTYIQDGLCLQVTPIVSGDTATVDLASILTEPNKIPPHALMQATSQPSIDRVDAELQHLHTTVQIPLNKPVLVAGTTADPNPQEPLGKLLYLIIEADSSK